MSAFAPIASTSTAGASSTANGVNGTSAAAQPDAALLTSLSSRLVQSGEWNRILRMLDLKLNASGWDDEVRVHAQGPFLSLCWPLRCAAMIRRTAGNLPLDELTSPRARTGPGSAQSVATRRGDHAACSGHVKALPRAD